MSWMQRYRLLIGRRRQKRIPLRVSVPLPDLHDAETGWYRRWYFLVRLGNEVSRTRESTRESTQEFSLVYGRFPLSALGENSRLRMYLTQRLSFLEREGVTRGGFYGRLSEDEFAVCIPSTEVVGSAAVAILLQYLLEKLSAETACVSFPQDGRDSRSLLVAVRRALREPPAEQPAIQGGLPAETRLKGGLTRGVLGPGMLRRRPHAPQQR